MILTGTAGSGKSRTVRSCVQARKALARAGRLQELRGQGLSEEAACKDADDFAEDVVSLAAPTGCAAFQMKSGAATVHRVHGVPCGFIARTSKEAQKSERFQKRRKRLKKASLFGFDEFSMIGRQMLGKVLSV